MAELDVNDGTGIVVETTLPTIKSDPVPGAEVTKPEEAPAAGAEEKKPEEETPEQVEQRRESRRSRARAREAAKLATAETEARLLREQLARAEAKQPTSAVEPKREDFESLEDFNRALARHEAKVEATKVIEADRKVRQEQETKARTTDTDKRISEAWSKGEEDFRKEAKDYDAVVGEFIEGELADLDPTARRAILELGDTGVGQKVLYHLAKNPDEAERIAKLSPTRQVIEIGKLEDKVTPPKKTSNAPPPVSGVKGASAIQGYRDNMSDAEYKAWRKGHGARWAN